MIRNHLTALLAVTTLALASHADAAVFTIDSSQSTISLDESLIDLFGLAQFLGTPTATGESTSLSGTLVAAVSSSSFELLPGSAITADDVDLETPGIPVGGAASAVPAPAAFSFTYPGTDVFTGADLGVATRDFSLSLDDAGARSLSGGLLGAATTEISVLSGEAHLNAGNPAVSDLTIQNITNISVGPGAYSLVGNLMTIELPIAFTGEAPDSASYSNYAGTIVATGVVPAPGSIAVAVVAMGLGLAARRSR